MMKHAMVFVTVLSIAAGGVLAVDGAVLYVDDDAPIGGDGSSWPTAFGHVQDALSAAQAAGGGEIRVAQGIYYPDRSAASPLGTGDRLATFLLRDGVTLSGGYAGLGSGDPGRRDTGLFPSVLTGDLMSNDDAAIPEPNADNAFHVIESWGNDASAVIDGFVIRDGYADRDFDDGWYPQRRDDSAGGALVVDSAAVFRDCVFTENHAEANASVWVALNGPFAFAEAGSGAMMVAGGSPTIEDCDFVGNTANRVGGALALHRTAARVSGCLFSGNMIGVDPNSGPLGGAIGDSSFSTGSDRARIESCLFVGNSSPEGGGGAVFAILSDSVYANCLFVANHARDGGGAVMGDNGSFVEFHNCVIVGNTAELNAGGVYEFSELADVYLFTNSIVWGNRSDEDVSPLNENMISLNGNFAIYDTIVENADAFPVFAFDASRVLTFEPGFADPVGPDGLVFSGDENLRLGPGSMAIDAGDSSRVPEWVTTDLDRRDRIVDAVTVPDTGVGPAPIVDLGAYESGPGCSVGDLAEPYGQLNFFDVSAMLSAFAAMEPQADLNHDGAFDFFDLSAFLQAFSAGCP